MLAIIPWQITKSLVVEQSDKYRAFCESRTYFCFSITSKRSYLDFQEKNDCAEHVSISFIICVCKHIEAGFFYLFNM